MFRDLSFEVQNTHVAPGHVPKKLTFQVKVSKLWVGILIYIDHLSSWAKKKLASKHCPKGANWPQRLDLSWTISDLSFDLRVFRVWHFKGTVCTVILRCCKPKSDKKCRSYVTLKHHRILNTQFDQFFRGLKRGVLDKIRCSQWHQGMVLDGLEWF